MPGTTDLSACAKVTQVHLRQPERELGPKCTNNTKDHVNCAQDRVLAAMCIEIQVNYLDPPIEAVQFFLRALRVLRGEICASPKRFPFSWRSLRPLRD